MGCLAQRWSCHSVLTCCNLRTEPLAVIAGTSICDQRWNTTERSRQLPLPAAMTSTSAEPGSIKPIKASSALGERSTAARSGIRSTTSLRDGDPREKGDGQPRTPVTRSGIPLGRPRGVAGEGRRARRRFPCNHMLGSCETSARCVNLGIDYHWLTRAAQSLMFDCLATLSRIVASAGSR